MLISFGICCAGYWVLGFVLIGQQSAPLPQVREAGH
jgi:hypothetical protein